MRRFELPYPSSATFPADTAPRLGDVYGQLRQARDRHQRDDARRRRAEQRRLTAWFDGQMRRARRAELAARWHQRRADRAAAAIAGLERLARDLRRAGWR